MTKEKQLKKETLREISKNTTNGDVLDSTGILVLLIAVVWETIIPTRHFLNANKNKQEDQVNDLIMAGAQQNSLAFA